MGKHFIRTCVLTGTSLLIFSSCASLFTKSDQEITFRGIPGTTVLDKNKNTVITEVGSNGFATAKIRKQLKSKAIEARRDGYQSGDFKLDTKIQGAFWGNILLGGIPGMAIDAATGKMMKYKTNLMDITLTPLPSLEEETVTEIITTPVLRTQSGVTDAEKAIIRWSIDSDPRGARIFWRVISNVPDEVKNTNETYLTTSPYEETRGFNIPGLTMDNANNVTVEIKVTKRGYEDQVKRYNVRQAIDQQEINGFYELVEK